MYKWGMKAEQYYQCKLVHGTREMIAWIESRGARVGLSVELLPAKETWHVAEVYEHGLPADVIKDMEHNYRVGMPSTRDTAKDRRKK